VIIENVVQPRSNGVKPIRVLMADQDESLHPDYRESLSQEGFDMATALSGLECVSSLREQAPDVLVLEPQLPWGGGDGVLAMMGEDPGLANIPVMVLTSCHDHHFLKHMTQFLISDYQLKPLTPDRLVERLRNLINHPGLRFTLAEENTRLECMIARRTGGRVWSLHVENIEGRIIVHGNSGSHHVKQLALAAVQEVFQASNSSKLVNIEMVIEVTQVDKLQSRRRASSATRNDNYLDELNLTKEN
jgi:response regulator RpfG family c-di-GMP phosphodiesterase